MANRLVSVDSITTQFPTDVRETVAANIEDPSTPEGAAVAAAVALGGGGGGGSDITVSPTPPAGGFWIEGDSLTVTATAPTFTDLSGSVSDTYTIPSVAHVEYLVGGVVKAAGVYPGVGSVTVTAQATGGFTLTGTALWGHTFATGLTVTPTAPTFNDTTDEYVIPTTTGVDYKIGGSTVAAGTYSVGDIDTTITVNAVAQSGYTLTGTTSWVGEFNSTTSDPLFRDTFTGTDGTALTGRTTDVAGATSTATWGGSSTAAMITSNAAAVHATNSLFATLDTGITTYRLTITAKTPVSACKLVLRYVDLDNYVYLEWRTSGGKWGVISRSGGTNTLVLDTGISPVAGQVLEIEADGTGYSVSVNGGTPTTGASTFLSTNTKVGFRATAAAHWDDLIIDNL